MSNNIVNGWDDIRIIELEPMKIAYYRAEGDVEMGGRKQVSRITDK
ncbi:MAG: hypothetical protein JJT76_00245 [Clostridiaceae bacterium]|nr:hypothetical protein [Clostridiaceae bacterium]